MQDDNNHTLAACFEQKLIQMLKIKQLTEQLIDDCISDRSDGFAVLFAQRQNSIDKIEKCRHLIDKIISELNENDRTTAVQILSNEMRSDQCPKLWQGIFNSNAAFMHTLKEVCTLDQTLSQCFADQRDKLLETKPNQPNLQTKNYR